jgi:hypothetical protein
VTIKMTWHENKCAPFKSLMLPFLMMNNSSHLGLLDTARRCPHARRSPVLVRVRVVRPAYVGESERRTLGHPARTLESARRAPLTSALLALWGAVNARYGAAVALPLLRAADKRAVAIREE